MNKIIGAIAGDVLGSPYEFNPNKTTDFDLFNPYCSFTDDTVMTIANMRWLLDDDHSKENLVRHMRRLGEEHPFAGYGGRFHGWLFNESTEPYNSYGNGSAMRVSPIGWAFNNMDDVLRYAKISAEVTHNHPEGIKGAQAVAASIFMARENKDKHEIGKYVTTLFGYNLNKTCNEIRPTYKFDETCQKSVPESIICFIEGGSYEETIRLAVSLGGDSDTMACIAGGIAEPYYGGVPCDIAKFIWNRLPDDFQDTINKFSEKYGEKLS